ncbi:MAG: alpha-L-rhamnosidase [Kiritimatiellae bacterium]|nr:alpha-L-rhamnosidase [Kiritimatiellia bacterium]
MKVAKAVCLSLFACAALSVRAGYLGEPKRTVAEVQYPERVFTNAAGRLCVDFGKDAFGWIEVDAPAAGLDYFLAMGERLRDDGTLERMPPPSVRCVGVKWRTERAGFQRLPIPPDLRNLFAAKEGAAIAIPKEFGVILPFRAVEIYECEFPVTKDSIRRHAVAYPADRNESSFACDDPRLTAVWDFCKYSMFATSFAGQFVDGDRERIPYEADAFVSQLNWYAISSDYAYPRKSIEYLYTHPTWPTEFKQISILSAWADWMWTGDTRSLERNYDLLKREKLLMSHRRSDGLLVTGGERRPHPHITNRLGLADIVDWPPSERDGFEFRDVNAVVNAFHCRDLEAMADMAAAIGKDVDAEAFRAQARETRASFQRAFFDAGRGLYLDGEGARHASIHANAVAIAFGLVPEDRVGRVADWVESRGMACSVYFSQYLLEALYLTGRDAAALKLLTADGDRSWTGMMKQGATITMEAWNAKVKPNLDWNHSWGAVPLNVISRFVLGVTPLEPGFAKVRVAPHPAGLKKVSASIPTMKGTIRLSIDGDDLTVDSPVPAEVEWRGTRRLQAAR